MVIDYDKRDLITRHRNISVSAATVFIGGVLGNLSGMGWIATAILLVMAVVYLQHALSDQAELRRLDLDLDD